MTGSITGSADGPAAQEPVVRRTASTDETRRANRAWWDAEADDYQAEHGQFLGAARLIWGPEGLDEVDAGLLGQVQGRAILEVGAGAAAGSRWLLTQGARPVAIDLSHRQLEHSRRLDSETDLTVPVLCADAERLPLRSDSFDLAFAAYGALPFAADAAAVMSEVARVLRPQSRWVFSVTHPVRWSFPDDPGPIGLTAERSYFDRRSYVEQDELGHATYVEHHRTVGDWVRLIDTAGFRLLDVVEPEWPDDLERVWGGWSQLRGRILPGTAIFCCLRQG